MFAGLIYSFFKWPEGCGCMLVIAAIVLLVLIWAFWSFVWPIALGVAALVAGVKVYKQWKAQQPHA